MAGGVASDVRRRAGLRLQVEHGVDARHARVPAARAGAPALAPRPADVRPRVRVHREFRAAAVARRGRPRQGLAARADARRRVAAVRDAARVLRVHVGAIRARSCCSWARSSRRAGVELAAGARLAPARHRLAPRRPVARARLQPRSIARQRALHERDCEGEGFRWIVVDDRDNSVFAWLRFGGDGAPPVAIVANFTPVPREGYRIGLPLAGRWREIAQHRRRRATADRNRGNAGGVDARPPATATASRASPQITLPPLATLWLVHDGQ